MKIELIIKPRWIITVDASNRVLEQHAIVVDDGKIIAILPAQEAEQSYQAGQTVELRNHALLPGFINAHTHAAMALMKGLADDLPLMTWLEKHIWPAEARLVNVDYVYEGAQLAIAEMIRSGTTCFNDMYFFPEACLQAADKAGIRAVLGRLMIDVPTAYAADHEAYLQQGDALYQACQAYPLISTTLAPHAPYTVSDEPLQALLTRAQQQATPLHMHVHETAFEVEQATAQHGERPLARLKRLGLLDQSFMAVHMTQLEAAEIELLAQQNVNVVHCPESNLKLASGFCPVAKLQAAGVNVALGTDGNASNNDLDMLGEMRTAALLGKAVAQDASALPAQEVLRMATINGAKALGLAEVTGSLEIGKAADMVAIDLGQLESQPLYDPVSHIVYGTTREQVTYVWVAGHRLLEERKLLTLDEAELLNKAHYWQSKIGEFS